MLRVLPAIAAFGLLVPVSARTTVEVPLGFAVPTDRPILVEIEETKRGAISVSMSGFDWSDALEQETELSFVDEHLKIGDGKEKARRKYIEERTKYNGEILDSALNGVSAMFEYDTEEEAWGVELENDRGLTGDLLNALLGQPSSLGLWIDLPEKARPYQKIEVDLRLISPLLVSEYSATPEKTELRVGEYDAKSGTVALTGKVAFTSNRYVVDTPITFRTEGEITIEVCSREQRIASIDYAGKFSMSSRGGSADVSGSGSHKIKIETEIDAKKVEREQKRKPKFRTKKILVERLGVGFKLPSHWTRLRSADGYVFIRTLDFDKGEAVIDLSILDADSSYKPEAYLQELELVLERKYPGMVSKKTKNPLGRDAGRVYYVPRDGDAEDGDIVQIEVYPHRDKYLMFRLQGPAAAYREAFEEFKRAKSTMGVLSPKGR